MKTRIKAIKKQLGIIGKAEDGVLVNLFARYKRIALDICHREENEITDTILDIVQDTVVSAYNQRGAEGMSSSNVGGQSYNFKDLTGEMRTGLIESGQRLARF